VESGEARKRDERWSPPVALLLLAGSTTKAARELRSPLASWRKSANVGACVVLREPHYLVRDDRRE